MEQKSRRDLHDIERITFSEAHKAKRVVDVSEKEVKFSLTHKEDSIVSKAQARVLDANTEHDCSDLQKVQAYGKGTLALNAGNKSIFVSVSEGQVLEICATSLKCDIVLVGR